MTRTSARTHSAARKAPTAPPLAPTSKAPSTAAPSSTATRASTTAPAFTVVSYNLWKNHAVHELDALAASTEADLLCLQEVYTGSMPDQIGDLRRIASTANNRLGLAIYGRQDRFDVRETRSYSLGRSMHDRIMSPTPERLVAARLVDLATDRHFVIASFHAAPLSARNSVRRAQIRAAHLGLEALGAGLPAMMIGDFNYPWFSGRLRRTLARTGHTLARAVEGTYRGYGVVRGRFDLVTATRFDLGAVRVLPQAASDHMPIIVRVEPRV
ncbi:endonuclease/exonuclease/phosphatase family protein [Frondihabitans peucedani]|uniref:Endonuclease/exonuclease/phosphatase domain-containing protein n=1 Tax=Frondihabitans peucedani TaxID=598626 RepID=A0ABP8E593_9MICO